jgi:hypothetical protein
MVGIRTLALIAWVVSACLPSTGVQRVVTFPQEPEIPAMQVEVSDLTGSVVAVAPAPAAMEDIDWGFASLPEGDKIAIGWVSSVCDTSARVTLESRADPEGGENRTLVTIETVAGRVATLPNGMPCDLELGGRTIIVTFSRPVDRSTFDLEVPGL